MHLFQREATAARSGEVFRAEAHSMAVAPVCMVERGCPGCPVVTSSVLYSAHGVARLSPARVDESLPYSEAACEARGRGAEAPRVLLLGWCAGIAAPVATLAEVVV